MADKYKEEFTRILKTITASLPKSAGDDVAALVAQYYAKLPLIDLERLDPQEASAIAAASHAFLLERLPGTPKLRFLSAPKGRVAIEILNDDMPFLVDSVTAELSRQGLAITHLIHPIIRLKRDKAGRLTAIAPAEDFGKAYMPESLIRIEITRLPETISEAKLTADLERVLESVRFTVEDWEKMRDKIRESIDELAKAPVGFKREEVDEIRDFLTWLSERNFVFLGYIEYDFYDAKGKQSLSITPASPLGIFKTDDDDLKPKGLEGLPPEVLHFALVPQLIEITKSMRKATVHRAGHMDYIGLKRFDAKGKVIGERRFLGLFTSSVYYQSAGDIPFIRRKIARILARASFDPTSHDGKSLKAILEFTPRDELFQFSDDDLFDYAMGVLSLESRPGVRLFVRRDAFERFVSCIVFLPRDRFSTTLREEVQSILSHALGGTVSAFYTQMTESPLARVQLIIAATPGHIPAISISTLEAEIARVTHRWSDALYAAFVVRWGEEVADAALKRFATAFPKTYISEHDAAAAVYDIQKINDVIESRKASLELFRNKNEADTIVHLKWYNPRTQIPLSEVLPMLENIGFKVIDEQPYLVRPAQAAIDTVWIRDFTLSADAALVADLALIKPLFEEALAKVWQGEMENDALNALVVSAHLPWRDVVVMRAYAHYLRQVNFPYGVEAIAAALSRYPTITRALLQFFHSRFDSCEQIAAPVDAIDALLANVTGLADDRILRRLLDLIKATLRTNYYQTASDGMPKSYLSFKFDSVKLPQLPLPRPFAEIFVYSPRVEGIHLRGGKVARGGLRWSDRPEDFRTEVLGLMKAQMIKNAVIVPVGSKGGFVLKRPPASREALMEEGIACYKIFLSGLLDITDNIVAGRVVAPTHVVRYDGDDPYLVVAADKGTASFSDIANGVADEYGFWLGDAFASGGSAGYDHKKMAITARGAFISVARHFREAGIDIHKQDFTVIGIGDMAGDVFGNGMLLSRHIRLIGAFNHQHIFLDPTPNAASSFAERERLFNLPRSSWKDYNSTLISKGGGVFERSAKSIALSQEVKKSLGITADILSPEELIRALLLAPVDLLWNGGIGTYVKAEDETHEQVGDRANNAVRVNGRELRCKVVGEGGNLGFTQKGRVEYALYGNDGKGGRINTDAIDNSAGVDCSDHEVNIKIALSAVMSQRTLLPVARDALLARMTDNVAELVLKDNRLQTQALTIAESQAGAKLDEHTRLIYAFERKGLLDRNVEFLPSDKQLAERRNEDRALTRPELAVLLAYSKMVLYDQLLNTSLPDDEYFQNDLLRYFPHAMQQDFASFITRHPLKREIIATAVTNSIVNRTGITLVHAFAEDTGLGMDDIARAYAAARDAFDLRKLWADIEALDGKVATSVQADLFHQATQFIERVMIWLLRNMPHPLNVTAITNELESGLRAYIDCYETIISQSIASAYREKIERFTAHSIPLDVATRVARLDILVCAADVVHVAKENGQAVSMVGSLYFELGAKLGLSWLRQQAMRLSGTSHWERMALQSVIGTLFDEQRRLTTAAMNEGTLAQWSLAHSHGINRFAEFITDLKAGEDITLSKLVIASHKAAEIARNDT